jgi:hypothetical protein
MCLALGITQEEGVKPWTHTKGKGTTHPVRGNKQRMTIMIVALSIPMPQQHQK